MEIRVASLEDLEQMVAIYNYYIRHSNATFFEEPLRMEDRLDWFNSFSDLGKHRLFVASDSEGAVLGYASSSLYRSYCSFDETVECSIYVSNSNKRAGIGTMLYNKLFESLKNERIHSFIAGIALPNEASVAFHKKFDFEEVGIFKEYAVKNGKYVSSLWLQRMMG